MAILSTILIIYGLMVLLVGIFKPRIVWNIKKLRIMSNMFKGDRNLQIFLVVFGLIVGGIGFLIK